MCEDPEKDRRFAPVGMTILLLGQVFLAEALAGTTELVIPNRSVAKWRDLQLLRRSHSSLSIRVAILPESNRPPLVIPTVADPDFLLRNASNDHVCGSP